VVAAAPAVKTRLTLHVPSEAKVTLAGTSKLASGQSWNDYKVVVEMNRDGKALREERTLKLTGGKDQELSISFADDSTQQVAQR
jgi:hypothetical protein